MTDEAIVNISTQAVVNQKEAGMTEKPDEQKPDLLRLRRHATELSPLPLVAVAGSAHIVTYANSAFCVLCGKTNEELIGNCFADVVPDGKENGCLALLDRVYRTGGAETMTDQEHTLYQHTSYQHAASRACPVYWSYTAWAMQDEEGRPTGVMIQVTDTMEATLNRRELSAVSQALMLSGVRQHERGEMEKARIRHLNQVMRETDHRVKNNLQMIGALLDMQIMAHADTVPVAELTQLRLQIKTLAAVHAMLVQDTEHAPTASVLSMQEMLQKLMPMLQEVVGKQGILWHAEDVRLTSKQGNTLALLINELVSNAVKHGGKQVELRLAVVAENVILEVLDDGPGFVEAFDPRTAANFGLELVETLSRHDLGGQTAYTNRLEGGACVRIAFPYLARK